MCVYDKGNDFERNSLTFNLKSTLFFQMQIC